MNDLRFALRQLFRTPGFAVVAILSLGLGLALAATTLATVNAYLVRSLPYPTADRVFHLRYAPPGPWEPRGMSAIDWTSLDDVVEDTITSSGATFYVSDGSGLKRLRAVRATRGFMRGLAVRAAVGRTFVEEEFVAGSPRVAMIGHGLWRERFASDPAAVGRELRVSGEDGSGGETLQIVGVLPADFWVGRQSTATVDVLTPTESRQRVYMVRLRHGVSARHAEQRITDVARSVGSDFRPGWTGVHLQSVHDRYVEDIRPVLAGVVIAVAIVLVLVCANVAVLVLLRAMRRQKEVAVRLALGAGRKHILRMLMVEASVICGAALLLGLTLTRVALHVLAPVIETQLGRPAPSGPAAIHVDSSVLLAVGGVGVAFALSLAFIPLLAPWQRRLANALRAQGTSTTDSPFIARLRSSLIAVEVAGAVVLLVACGLMIRSAVNLTRTDLGFEPERVIRIGLRLPARTYAEPMALHRFFASLLERIPGEPNSRVALMSAFPSFYPANTAPFEVEERSDQTPIGVMRVGAGYFDLYAVKLVQGREFTTADRIGSTPVSVVSATLAQQLWPNGAAAVGRRIRVVEGDMPDSPLGPWRTIVGVVGDIRQGYDDADLRDVYLPFLQVPGRHASVHVRTDSPPSFWSERVRAAAWELDPYVMVGDATTIVSEDQRRAAARFLTWMLTGFAVFAAFLAVLGIYGVTSYAVQQRDREIAIRAAVGADSGAIVRMFLRQGAGVMAAGLVLGLIGAVIASKLLQNQLYGIGRFDPAAFISSCALIGAAGLLATWLPARWAASATPVIALKND